MCKSRKPSQRCHNSQKSTQWITDLTGKNKAIKFFKGYEEENLPNFSLEGEFLDTLLNTWIKKDQQN